MSMVPGSILCIDGLAKRIYDARVASFAALGLELSVTGDGLKALRADCFAIASAVVAEITANAEVVISPITGAGLQTSTAPGAPTAPPSPLEKTLPIR